MLNRRNVFMLMAGILLTLPLLISCSDDDKEPEPEPKPTDIPNTCLVDNKVIISDIVGIPDNVAFNKLKAEITGACWEVITLVEASYKDGKAELSLPLEFSAEDLQMVVRIDGDMCGHWPAKSSDNDALVAALGDITAYENDKPVGILSLTDWSGEGSSEYKSFVYYHYADRPFQLSGSNSTYRYDALFKKGWNAYANVNSSEEARVSCTTSIPAETPLIWHFKGWVY